MDGDCLMLPIMCLSLYDRDGTLEMVYPYTDDDETYSVEDGLTGLGMRPDREDDGDETVVKTELSTAT